MRRQRIALFCTLALLAVLPQAAGAQQQLRGTWTLNRQQSDDVNAKINTAVAGMNVVVRQIARPRLRNTNTPYPQLVIHIDGGNYRVDMQGRPSVSSPTSGAPVLWHRETGRVCTPMRGDCVSVNTVWSDGRLTQTFRAEDGQRVNVYTVEGNTLTMDVTVTSPRLRQPLTYRLVYNRAS